MTALQQKMPLGDQLVHSGLLMEVQLELAKREQQRHGGRLGPILVQLRVVRAEALARFLARQAGTETGNLNRISVGQSGLSLFPLEIARPSLGKRGYPRHSTLTA